MTNIAEKLETFRQRVETETIQRLHEQKLDCEGNLINARVTVKTGKKYVKVDIGSSGRFMVEVETGNIFGIKAYGQIHRGHFYGTLDTINEYFWGNYSPRKLDGSVGLQKANGYPIITRAPVTEPVVSHTAVVKKMLS